MFFGETCYSRYLDRPDQNFYNGKCRVLHGMFFAEFLAHYYLAPKHAISGKDSQPAILDNKSIELNYLKL